MKRVWRLKLWLLLLPVADSLPSTDSKSCSSQVCQRMTVFNHTIQQVNACKRNVVNKVSREIEQRESALARLKLRYFHPNPRYIDDMARSASYGPNRGNGIQIGRATSFRLSPARSPAKSSFCVCAIAQPQPRRYHVYSCEFQGLHLSTPCVCVTHQDYMTIALRITQNWIWDVLASLGE